MKWILKAKEIIQNNTSHTAEVMGEADSSRRRGQVEIHRQSRLVPRPPAESAPPHPWSAAEAPVKVYS